MWPRRRTPKQQPLPGFYGRQIAFTPEPDGWTTVPVGQREDDMLLAEWAARAAYDILGEVSSERQIDALAGVLDDTAMEALEKEYRWAAVLPRAGSRWTGDLNEALIASVSECVFVGMPTFDDVFAALSVDEQYEPCKLREATKVLLPTGHAIRQLVDETGDDGVDRLVSVHHLIEPASDPVQPYVLLTVRWYGPLGSDGLLERAEEMAAAIRILPGPPP